MAIAQPTDGHFIYEFISPNVGASTYQPRLDKIKAAGFKLVMNYAIMAGSTANMIAYINYAASIGLKVIVSVKDVWQQSNLSTAYPTIYTEAGSPGITNYNALVTYVVNQVKSLAGTWGYYIADEAADTDHTAVHNFYGYITAADNTKPILLISTGDLGTGTTFWGQDSVFYDCCTVGGDDHYIIGLTNRADDPQSVASGTQSYCTLKSIKSCTVLQANNDTGTWPTLQDQIYLVEQTTAHMQAQIIGWYSYYSMWGTPTSWLGFGPVSADGSAATYWNNLTLALAYNSRYVEEVLVDSPVRGYRLSDSPCSALYDDLVSSNQLTPTAPSRTTSLLTGDADGAMSFNGSSSKFSIPTTGLSTGNHAYTIECWVKLASIPGGGNYPFALGLGSDVQDEQLGLYFNGDVQRLALTMKNHDVNALAAPTAGAIYHLVGVYSGGVASFYVNGVLQGTMSRTLNMVYGAAYIGLDPSGGLFWPGIVDDVWIYTTALSASRILAHYNAGQAIGPSARPLGNGRFARIA
jgi:Concanavalin A-like lectin/glucanases superfamily